MTQVQDQMDQAPMDIEQLIVNKAMENKAFKQELLSNPKAAIAKELNTELPAEIEIEVVQQTPQKLYLVLPLDVEQQEVFKDELSEEQLEAVAGGATPAVATAVAATVGATVQIWDRVTKKWPC
jgi:hypothetical protein